MRVLLNVTIRLSGRVDRDRWRTPSDVSKPERTDNMLWAIGQLEGMDDDDPRVAARLGEAYQRMANRQDDAIRVLGALAESDLMPDLYGYAALSRAYSRVGRIEDRDRAAQACRQRASRVQQGICPGFAPVGA